MKWSFIVPPLITVTVALFGKMFTEQGLSWFFSLMKPSWTPNGEFIGLMWATIYILTTVFAIYIWNNVPRTGVGCAACMILGLLLLNAVLNASWSYAFFAMQSPGFALFILVMLELTNIFILILGWQQVRLAALLMVPYVAWVAIAGILNYRILVLN